MLSDDNKHKNKNDKVKKNYFLEQKKKKKGKYTSIY